MDTATPDAVVTGLLQYGITGIVCVLLIMGWLVPKWAYSQLQADRDQWRAAYETERSAHAATSAAMSEHAARGDVASDAARATLAMLHTAQGGMS